MTPGVVVCTTYLKGLCMAGDMPAAAALLRAQTGRPEPPNIRTVNTFLRGCMMHGALAMALDCYRRMARDWGVAPDTSALEYVVQMMCQGLQLADAEAIVRRMVRRSGAAAEPGTPSEADVGSGPLPPQSVASACVSLARAAAVLRDRATCLWALEECAAALAAEGGAAPAAAAAAGGGRAAQGGKRGWRDGGDARAKSLATYAAHRRDSTRREAALLREVVAADAKLPSALPYLLRTLPLGGAPVAGADALVARLRDSFGLTACLDACTAAPPVAPDAGDDARAHAQKKGRKREKRAQKALECFRGALGEGGRLNFGALFEGAELPVKLEICSGAGEWAVAQAHADGGRAVWGALELRYDRVHAGLCCAIFQRVPNICHIAGDAQAVLERHVADGAVQRIFVMHPEPPQQCSNAADAHSESAHLLSHAFVREMGRTLCVDGTVCIVTDSLWYARLLLDVVAGVCEADGSLKSAAPQESGYEVVEERRVNATAGLVYLMQGDPGADCGVADVSASSYFHRLKRQEKASRRQQDEALRYFLMLRKQQQAV